MDHIFGYPRQLFSDGTLSNTIGYLLGNLQISCNQMFLWSESYRPLFPGKPRGGYFLPSCSLHNMAAGELSKPIVALASYCMSSLCFSLLLFSQKPSITPSITRAAGWSLQMTLYDDLTVVWM